MAPKLQTLWISFYLTMVFLMVFALAVFLLGKMQIVPIEDPGKMGRAAVKPTPAPPIVETPAIYHEKHPEVLEKILAGKIRKIQPPNRVTARRNIVRALGQAQAAGRHEEAAELNALLAQEAFQRAWRTMKAWEGIREPRTGLIRRSFTENIWNGKDSGADCFPYLLIAGQNLDPPSQKLWLATLESEGQISTTIPLTIDLRTLAIIDEDAPWRTLFQGAEYAKDGLLVLTERLGRGPWFERLEQVLQAVIDASFIPSTAGMLPGGSSEVNGDLLLTLPRLYWATGNEKYLEMAERIAEAFLFEVMPNNHGLPAHDWDFVLKKPFDVKFRFREHGSEIIPGFVELYLLEKMQNRPQAQRYREPIKALLDRVVTTGRTKGGIWHNTVNTTSGLVIDRSLVDTWGYLLGAWRTFDLAEGTHEYDAEIQRAMRGAASLRSVQWEGEHFDGYADTIECMIQQLRLYDIPECRAWVDDEIEQMFLMQHESGFVSMDYIDGNFIKTSLLYGEYKTQGAYLDPWNPRIRWGASFDGSSKTLHLYMNSPEPWRGVIRFDYPRHKAHLNLPFNYPRINAWPEWFVAEPDSACEITDLETGKKRRVSGEEMKNGIPVLLNGKRPARWIVTSPDASGVAPNSF